MNFEYYKAEEKIGPCPELVQYLFLVYNYVTLLWLLNTN